MAEIITRTPEETIKLGRTFGARLVAGDVVFLEGELGAGKTTFVRGVAAACGIERAEDIVSLFADPIYFGCEADDKMTGIACSGKSLPFGSRLKPVLGSDCVR